MGLVSGKINLSGLFLSVVLELSLQVQDPQHLIGLVREGYLLALFETGGLLPAYPQCHRNAPGEAVGQAHGFHHRAIVLAVHEPLEGAEAAHADHVEV